MLRWARDLANRACENVESVKVRRWKPGVCMCRWQVCARWATWLSNYRVNNVWVASDFKMHCSCLETVILSRLFSCRNVNFIAWVNILSYISAQLTSLEYCKFGSSHLRNVFKWIYNTRIPHPVPPPCPPFRRMHGDWLYDLSWRLGLRRGEANVRPEDRQIHTG